MRRLIQYVTIVLTLKPIFARKTGASLLEQILDPQTPQLQHILRPHLAQAQATQFADEGVGRINSLQGRREEIKQSGEIIAVLDNPDVFGRGVEDMINGEEEGMWKGLWVVWGGGYKGKHTMGGPVIAVTKPLAKHLYSKTKRWRFVPVNDPEYPKQFFIINEAEIVSGNLHPESNSPGWTKAGVAEDPIRPKRSIMLDARESSNVPSFRRVTADLMPEGMQGPVDEVAGASWLPWASLNFVPETEEDFEKLSDRGISILLPSLKGDSDGIGWDDLIAMQESAPRQNVYVNVCTEMVSYPDSPEDFQPTLSGLYPLVMTKGEPRPERSDEREAALTGIINYTACTTATLMVRTWPFSRDDPL